ncbi:MAG TPA: aspartyl protease [Firmicutes bacterium]|jgi:predicted aspartyl protease|nr:aspartyl protease [Bacillota bacterium]
MDLEYRNGLFFVSLKIAYKGKEKIIENIVVDTGASETIISPDAVEDIKIIAELDDNINSYYGVGGSIHNFFTKKIDEISIDTVLLRQVKVDFGVIDPKGKINGLLGLDLLQKAHSVIDLKNMIMSVN